MSAEEKKIIATDFYQEQDRLKGKLLDELTAPNYTANINGSSPITRASHEKMAAILWTAFPDIEQIVEETVAEGDKVAVSFTLRATHKGNFMGTAPMESR